MAKARGKSAQLKRRLTAVDVFYIKGNTHKPAQAVANTVGCSLKMVEKILAEVQQESVPVAPAPSPAKASAPVYNPQVPHTDLKKGATVMTESAAMAGDDAAKAATSLNYNQRNPDRIYVIDPSKPV